MQTAAMIAFDAEKTAQIVFQYGEMQDEYDGYTKCTRIIEEENEIALENEMYEEAISQEDGLVNTEAVAEVSGPILKPQGRDPYHGQPAYRVPFKQ